MKIRVIYFFNNGRERFFERTTVEEAEVEYRRRRNGWSGAHWGHYYKDGNYKGERIYL